MFVCVCTRALSFVFGIVNCISHVHISRTLTGPYLQVVRAATTVGGLPPASGCGFPRIVASAEFVVMGPGLGG